MTLTVPSKSASTIKFDTLGKTRLMTCKKALSFAKEEMESQPGCSLYFTNLVVSRAMVTTSVTWEVRTSPSGLLECHISVDAPIAMKTWYGDGPFTAEQFVNMMRFPTEASNFDWSVHLNRFKSIELSSSEKKTVNKNS